MNKRLVIIGNAAVEKDFSVFVNSTDEVIRFNWLNNIGGNTGSKVSALSLASAKQHMQDYLISSLEKEDRHKRLNFVLERIETLIFPIPGFDRNCINRLKRIDDFISSFSLSDKRVRTFFCEKRYYNKLKAYGWDPAYKAPSSGFTVIMNVIDSKEFMDYDIYLLGFSWRGWDGHPWYNEKMVINDLSKKGMLEILI